jgi:hypothetical protein
MSRDASIFARVRPWLGWLVLAGELRGDHQATSGIADRLLEKADPSLGVIWIDPEAAASPGVERVIEDIEPLLAAPVERLGPRDDMPGHDLEIGLILMTGRDIALWHAVLGSSPTGRWVADRLDTGSVVFACGGPAAALGAVSYPEGPGGPEKPGLGWLPGAVLLPGVSHPADHPEVKQYLSETDHSYALGLEPGAAVAIGPNGEVEVWAGGPPKIVLGRGWMTT